MSAAPLKLLTVKTLTLFSFFGRTNWSPPWGPLVYRSDLPSWQSPSLMHHHFTHIIVCSTPYRSSFSSVCYKTRTTCKYKVQLGHQISSIFIPSINILNYSQVGIHSLFLFLRGLSLQVKNY